MSFNLPLITDFSVTFVSPAGLPYLLYHTLSLFYHNICPNPTLSPSALWDLHSLLLPQNFPC